MAAKKKSLEDIVIAETTRAIAELKSGEKKTGRPRLNDYDQDKKLTLRVPDDTHRLLQLAAFLEKEPMGKIAIDALNAYLAKYAEKKNLLEG